MNDTTLYADLSLLYMYKQIGFTPALHPRGFGGKFQMEGRIKPKKPRIGPVAPQAAIDAAQAAKPIRAGKPKKHKRGKRGGGSRRGKRGMKKR